MLVTRLSTPHGRRFLFFIVFDVCGEGILISGLSVFPEGEKDDPPANQIYNQGFRILIANNEL